MNLLSKELVSDEYRTSLKRDLAQATVCRFLIAYVSNAGIDSIGTTLLCTALRDQRSFGVSSLSCRFGYEPFLELHGRIGSKVGTRLKYFMDPMIRESNDLSDLALLHSKLVYLVRADEKISIVYIGSHNWTEYALGPGGPRNAEASIRYEMDFTPEDLEGNGTSLASDVNRHLLRAWKLPLCLPVTQENRFRFEEWFEKGCRNVASVPLQTTTIILTVLKDFDGLADLKQLSNLEERGIYVQMFEEEDGSTAWDSGDRLLVLVWKSKASLEAGEQPVLLHCRTTTNNAGPDSQLHGTNQSIAPIVGFKAIILDEQQNRNRNLKPQSTQIWSGQTVDYFDFKYSTRDIDSSEEVDKEQPRYQFYLEVEKVIFPAEGDIPENPEFVWNRETFAVAERQNSARFQKKPGFYVEPEVRDEMLACLQEEFHVDLDSARVLPFSEIDRFKIGKRVSRHPLHDTFIGRVSKEEREVFYEKVASGSLVADIDEPHTEQEDQRVLFPRKQHISRCQRVFTMRLSHLFEVWKDTAKKVFSNRNSRLDHNH